MDIDESGPDYDFSCVQWRAEGKFDPTIIGSRFGDHNCEFHEYDGPEEYRRCVILIYYF